MYLDVDVLLALIKERDFHKEYALKVCSLQEEKYTSIISLVELEIVIKREMSDIMSMEILKIMEKLLPEVKILACDKKIFEKSLELRKRFGLGIFDSLHAATALQYDKRIASTDNVYKRIKELKIII